MTGKTILHYRVLEKLGEGGMGVVYRARDERLNRDVAIKVLPEAVAGDAERLARFESEARLLASLNHAGIAAIYGLEKAEGAPFLVLELVEGETLRGPLSWEEALPIARQICEALEAAHEKGIVHRDLKPANIKVTPEGKVKVLDFGLAKAFSEETVDTDPSQSPTLTAASNAGGSDPGHGRLHESGAGAGQARGQAHRHLGVRVRAVRDAEREAGVRGREHHRYHGVGGEPGAGVGRAAGRDAG